MKTEIIKDACQKSVKENQPFPEAVRRLAEAGVESYFADLNRLRKIYYAPCGETFVTQLETQPLGTVAEEFDAAKVKQAIEDSRERKIGYVEFLRRIVAAGTFAYTVHIRGRRAIYLGRTGDMHVEHFPARSN